MAVFLTGHNPIKRTITHTVTETVTSYPKAYDASNYSYASISNANNPVGKSSGNESVPATISLKTGGNAETYVYYPFDFSSIPENATIKSVTCTAKAYSYAVVGSQVSAIQMQLFSGTTAKGSATTLPTDREAKAISCGTWTRAQLQNCRLRLFARRNSNSQTNTSAGVDMYFYGAEVTVAYTTTYEEEEWV